MPIGAPPSYRRTPASRVWAFAAAATAGSPAHAAGLDAVGPWIFGAVALVLVAALAWRAGRAAASRPDAAPPAPPPPPQVAAAAAASPPIAAPAADGAGPSPLPPTADELSQFSFTVSHDLRAPLRVVEGFARILKEDYGRQLDRIGNDHLDRVLAAAARMNSMIDAMLSIARISGQPLQRQPVNLSQLAGFIADDLQRAAPERQVEVRIEPGLLALGDPTLLRQVLENLLGNAWKYSARVEQARIEFLRSDHAGTPVFEVRDNGAGFDMRSADRLFGLFQRLHSASDFAGTGVGLASVQRIVQRHGGKVWAESAPGQGARFFFTLPG